MIAAILHNQQRDREARLHIMASVHTIMEKMNIPIDDVPSTFKRFTSLTLLHDEQEGPSDEEWVLGIQGLRSIFSFSQLFLISN
ncbi:unnamed protein product [Linum trigynum]|uniref:Uncharacterized protein n=1 Tax=Linum trigynum TaxID=586398 RepID=A0AAV2FBX2_9ROSI